MNSKHIPTSQEMTDLKRYVGKVIEVEYTLQGITEKCSGVLSKVRPDGLVFYNPEKGDTVALFNGDFNQLEEVGIKNHGEYRQIYPMTGTA